MAQRKSTAKEAEAKTAARRASIDDLLGKKPLRKTVTVFNGDEEIEVEFQSIGRKRYNELVSQHTVEKELPVLDDDGNAVFLEDNKTKKTEVREVLDEEAFARAIVAASASDPVLPLEAVETLADSWNSVEFDELVFAAIECNISNKIEAKGKG